MTDELGDVTKSYTITFHRRSKHSAARVWRALTDPDEVERWTEAPAKVDLRVGGSYVLFAEADEPEACVIVQIEPEHVLTYVWGLSNPPAWGRRASVVQWTIDGDEDGDGCTLTFVHNGCADRGDGEEGLAAGWHGFLDQLDGHLDGTTISADEGKEIWERRHEPYLERLTAAIR
jgi:uncharacterized protein YndB with AHSA1/START domain